MRDLKGVRSGYHRYSGDTPLTKRQIRRRAHRHIPKFSTRELWERGRGDHGGIVGRQAGCGKENGVGKTPRIAVVRSPVLQATPPEMIMLRASISSADRIARRSSSSITVLLKRCQQVQRRPRRDAQPIFDGRFAIRGQESAPFRDFGIHISCASTHRRTAVLRPLKLKSSVLPFIFASVNCTPFGLPCGASWSITGPPG